MKDIKEIIREVYEYLGTGYRENVYERAICHELLRNNIRYECQLSMDIHYKDEVVGELICDIALPDDKVIIELKAIYSLKTKAFLQLFTYMNASGYPKGYLVNYTQSAKSSIKIIEVFKCYGYFLVRETKEEDEFIKDTFYDFKGNFVDEQKFLEDKKRINNLLKRRVWIDDVDGGFWIKYYFIDGLFYRFYNIGVYGLSIQEFDEWYPSEKYKIEEL